MKVLSIVESAYRGTLEEQDDTILWLCQTLRGAGADLAVLLRGNAVNYAVRGQDASGLAFGALTQTQPPCLDLEVLRLVDGGARVYLLEEDLADRGIRPDELVPGLEMLARREVAKLFSEFDRIFHW